MRKEYICKECGGSGYVAQGKYFQGFGDSMQGICCPSCNGTGHIPLSEMLMLVNEALCRVNECFRNGFVETGKPHFAFTGLMSAENYLALAVVRLREIAKIEGFGLVISAQYANFNDVPEMIISMQSKINSGMYSTAMSLLLDFSTHHKIPLEKHIEALNAYEKESE